MDISRRQIALAWIEADEGGNKGLQTLNDHRVLKVGIIENRFNHLKNGSVSRLGFITGINFQKGKSFVFFLNRFRLEKPVNPEMTLHFIKS